jgi:hypothetical protein
VVRHKQSSAELIDDLLRHLHRIFPAVDAIDTSGRSITHVVKRIAQAILLDDYAPSDLSLRLTQIANGEATSSVEAKA